MILASIDPLDAQSPIFKDGLTNQAQMDEPTARGGIGEIFGRFTGAKGHMVDSEINRMIISYDIRQNHCPRTVAARGEYKQSVTLVALRGGWTNGLVTDERTARWSLTR